MNNLKNEKEDSIRVLESLFKDLFDQPVIGNTIRGFFAEALVADLLGCEWKLVSKDWASWDLEHIPTGLRGEVKQSAAFQTWTASYTAKNAAPRFDIKPRKGYWEGSEWVKEYGRPADIYFGADIDSR